MVRGVFGLDGWPHATSRSRTAPTTSAAATTGSDPSHARHEVAQGQLASQTLARYGFADTWIGRGETIGILRYGGVFDEDDFVAALRDHGVPAPTIEFVSVDDASKAGHHDDALDVELAIDVQVAAAHAPGARIVLYATPHGERGLLDALSRALFDSAPSPSIFTISFGYPERRWTQAALARLDELAAVAACLGVTLLAASGDSGAAIDERGEPHVSAPASNRYVLACGGTIIDTTGSEAAWERSGGGFSAHAEAPPWQREALGASADGSVPNQRLGVPDVAGQVLPGYHLKFRGKAYYGTGTSAIAPLWAAFIARLNERLGVRAGFIAPLLYRTGGGPAPLRAIVSGGNDRYSARDGWSAVTGLGVPDGEALFTRLAENTGSVKP